MGKLTDYSKRKKKKMVTLFELNPGNLFRYDDTICLKSEYRNDSGAVEAFILGTGEMFWGGTNTGIELNQLLVEDLGDELKI